MAKAKTVHLKVRRAPPANTGAKRIELEIRKTGRRRTVKVQEVSDWDAILDVLEASSDPAVRDVWPRVHALRNVVETMQAALEISRPVLAFVEEIGLTGHKNAPLSKRINASIASLKENGFAVQGVEWDREISAAFKVKRAR
jgi:hypothetical protein